MRLVIFGLTISSSWGNGHATLWRGLVRALARAGHSVTFFERDAPYYAEHRDLTAIPGGELVLYARWDDVRERARRALLDADAAVLTSYCPDGAAASRSVFDSRVPMRIFYDLDTPVTLQRLSAGEQVDYLPREGLGGFDLVLSYTGGDALVALEKRLGAKRVAPLYGSVDPEQHRPVPPDPRYAADLSYMGTYATDRQRAVDLLFLEPARRLPARRFRIGGAQYPREFPWRDNIWFSQHVPPGDHPAFFCSSRLTLNVTRGAMAEMGFCPSGRLFEAAACGTPLISDWWMGLEQFFEPGAEILPARRADDVVAALELGDAELLRIARAARARALDEHTAARRAAELVEMIEAARPGA